MQWIDIGANLTHDSFDADREQVIARASAHGVTQIVVTGASLAGSAAAVQLAARHPGTVFATAGVHPHHAQELRAEDLPQLRALLAAPGVVAAGECGLDYYRNYSPRAAQLRAFEWQLQLAADCGLPVFLHQRDAHEDFLALLRAHRAALAGGVAHCFTAGEQELEQYLALDLSIGITGWFCDERRGAHLRALVARIPAQRLLLETDAPYLLPRDLAPRPASRRNEPMYLPHIGAAIAAARAETVESCAAHTTAHARAFFRLPQPHGPRENPA
ncbi:MAG TPA: TatD family hydrolase [Steroidobacteraceae bacterium]|jgi:TatD DNase family protein|nr:TatD family hydrolase [Steroidobacteraceae bacterium]